VYSHRQMLQVSATLWGRGMGEGEGGGNRRRSRRVSGQRGVAERRESENVPLWSVRVRKDFELVLDINCYTRRRDLVLVLGTAVM
jgi:hypothetical protein